MCKLSANLLPDGEGGGVGGSGGTVGIGYNAAVLVAVAGRDRTHGQGGGVVAGHLGVGPCSRGADVLPLPLIGQRLSSRDFHMEVSGLAHIGGNALRLDENGRRCRSHPHEGAAVVLAFGNRPAGKAAVAVVLTKAMELIVGALPVKTTAFRLVQPEKEPVPMVVTELGMVMEVRLVQP